MNQSPNDLGWEWLPHLFAFDLHGFFLWSVHMCWFYVYLYIKLLLVLSLSIYYITTIQYYHYYIHLVRVYGWTFSSHHRHGGCDNSLGLKTPFASCQGAELVNEDWVIQVLCVSYCITGKVLGERTYCGGSPRSWFKLELCLLNPNFRKKKVSHRFWVTLKL